MWNLIHFLIWDLFITCGFTFYLGKYTNLGILRFTLQTRPLQLLESHRGPNNIENLDIYQLVQGFDQLPFHGTLVKTKN